jgi:hypothetical protein
VAIVRPPAHAAKSAVRDRERSAPIKGLNSADLITDIGDGYAQVADNWICRADGLHVRKGYTVAQTLGSPITSLNWYPGSVVARTDGDWMGDVVANAGGRFLVIGRNGAAPLKYDGSSFTTAVITGVDSTKLSMFRWHVRRLWAIEHGTLNLWYLDADAIGGPARLLPLQALARRGGELVSIASMKMDGGDGPEDRLAIITSEGELIIFSGSNPNDSATWSLVGVYTVPPPVGKRCFAPYGTGVTLLTVKGLLSVPQVLSSAASGKPLIALSRNITPTLEPLSPSAVIDSEHAEVTIVHAGSVQYVRDAETKGWTRWTGLNASHWLDTPEGLFFVSGNQVRQYDGGIDGEQAVKTVVIDGADRFGVSGKKTFRRIKPIYKIAQPYRARIEFLPDYRDVPASWEAASINSKYWFWEDITWPSQPMQWERPVSARLGQWRGAAGRGDVAAMMMGAQFSEVEGVFMGYIAAFEVTGSRS